MSLLKNAAVAGDIAVPSDRAIGRRGIFAALRKKFDKAGQGEAFYRHRLPIRITHWTNALCILVLLASGLNIFNAHPRLYWGQYGADADKPVFSIATVDRNGGTYGVTQLGPWHFDTTGVLGWSKWHGHYVARGWPAWLTIPSFQDLADARHWHFLFAWVLAFNGLAYLGWSLFSRHFQKDILPTVSDIKAIPHSVIEHAKFKHPTGEAAKRYNPLQRLAYLGVILLISLMVLTGLTMSPGFNAVCPWLLELFGGRQSARSIHFLSAFSIVLFVTIHLVEVVLAGPINEVRSMLTGIYVVPKDHEK
ncbi:cytochrome b/b6 domain-containing protein [uncultured Methylovirgula sp.]|uniref:cytochrome b/b6 domain-containing protein n=1 Tax=uncultured Methylovirgula sp. TaxID=1285960 RepID=UPI00260ED7E2|nr:cytochrome b/b6 domain-containing protein [uncultured Methylovirgula sp.]